MIGGKKGLYTALRMAGIVAIIVAMLPVNTVDASQITSRSLTLQAGAADGGSKPGGVVKHFYQFTVPSGTAVAAIKFVYCTTAAGTCTLPPGLVTTSSTLTIQTGVAGLTLNNATNGTLTLSKASGSAPSPSTLTYQFSTITNPSAANTTFYSRITTYSDTGATTPIDTGVVAASTANPIVLTGTMPESLIFCTGASITVTGGIPDCSTATAGNITFNQLFSPVDTATATSIMAATTNANNGYVITVNGTTMTSGTHTINAMASATTGSHGTGQFGMNLRANTTATSTTPVGVEIAPTSNGTNYKGESLAGYNTIDTFKFVSGDSVADSANGGAGPTDPQVYTASYIVNVPGSQAAGTYTTTLTYICTPTF